jgi:uncharacterized phage protein (TIGR02218 family)
MPYNTLETSIQSGQPRELYYFTYKTSEWFFTSAGEQITIDDRTYEPVYGLDRSRPEQSKERNKINLTVTMPLDNPVAQLFRGGPPVSDVGVIVYRMHFDDTQKIVFWQGTVDSAPKKNQRTELLCVPFDDRLSRHGLRRGYGPQCNWMLYDPDTCGVNKDDFLTTTTAQIIQSNGLIVKSAALALQANTWFRAGFIERVSDGDTRYITAHTGDELTLLQPFPHLAIGEQIKVYAGCNHTYAECKLRFNVPQNPNGRNFGGYHRIPAKNLFKEGAE